MTEKHTKKRRQQKLRYSVIGVDSETCEGPPISFQFYSEHTPVINGCVFLGKKSPLETFIRSLNKLPPGNYRMYGHNLEFDMLSFLWDKRASIRDGEIDLAVGAWQIQGRYSKPIFAIFADGKRYVELIDSFLWFMTSLDRAAQMVCPDLPKLKRPAQLGTKIFTAKDDGFVEYAMRDAEVAFHVGCQIERFHQELDIPPQISLASMASTIFRLHYLKANVYQPPLYEWMVGATASYHGGVNRVRPGASPAWHMNVTALDLSSAYPYAMTMLPALDDVAAFKQFKGSVSVKKVPELGIYRVSGTFAKCDWPAAFDHDFKPLQGKFTDTWMCGHELNEALRTGEIKIKSLTGYYADASNEYSPFKAYAEDFYHRKNTATDPILTYMFKIVLNGLTGKFIQTSPDYTLADGKLVKIRRAGGLYHPFVASLITGHTRAVMHAAEHEYEAIHTATDGIFVPGSVSVDTPKSLGALVSEGEGDLALFRNKLYLFYSHAGDTDHDKAMPSQAFGDRVVLKCARHGFQGTVGDLEGMLTKTDRKYTVNKPIKLKTALKSDQPPNKFVTTERRLLVTGKFGQFKYR